MTNSYRPSRTPKLTRCFGAPCAEFIVLTLRAIAYPMALVLPLIILTKIL